MEHPPGPPQGRSSKAFYVWVLLGVGALLAVTLIVSRDDTGTRGDAERGADLFRKEFTVERGLGPLFNERACSKCHFDPVTGGMGRGGLKTELRVGRFVGGDFDAMLGRGGPVAHAHSISGLGVECERTAGIPAGANVTSVRNTPALFGAGAIDAIPDSAIIAGAAAKYGVSGRPNLVRGSDGRRHVGRFGWKASTPALERFVAEALRDELGVTSPLAPVASVPGQRRGCEAQSSDPEIDRDAVEALTAFVAALQSPQPPDGPTAGEAVFQEIGCAACHTPTLGSGSRRVTLYSDLLLHDVGPVLDDRVVQGSATGPEWRTTPLWGLADRKRLLHDGRATTIEAAILAHGGEAQRARDRFRALSPQRRRSLLAFLRSARSRVSGERRTRGSR
jgi:CxxC motif-containing protein (DUF1111 family)